MERKTVSQLQNRRIGCKIIEKAHFTDLLTCHGIDPEAFAA
jgi:hypothetical protein